MAFFAGGGGHDVWKPRKTMRDWGRTEYRIIRNWTPRDQRGSGPSHPTGSSAHSANGSQAVGGEMEHTLQDPGLSDHNQEEEDTGEVRREGGSRPETSRSRHEGGSRPETSQSRHEGGSRLETSQSRHKGGSRLETSQSRHEGGSRPETSRSRHEGGSRPETSRSSHQQLQQSREQANGRTRQKPPLGSHAEANILTDMSPATQDGTDSPPANSFLTSQYSPPANSFLMSQDSPPANSRLTSQDSPPANSPPANSRLTSQDSPPANSPLANSRLTLFSNRTARSTGHNLTSQSPTIALHQSQVSHDTVVDRSEDGSSGSQAEDLRGPDQSDHHMNVLSTSSVEDRSRTAGASSRSLDRNNPRRSGRGFSDSRPRRELGTSPVGRSQYGSTRLAKTQTDLPETSTRQNATKGGRGRGHGRGRSKGRRQQGAPAEKVSVRLWQPRHTSRTAKDLGELDVCLSLYHDQLREALESAESVAGERALASHWKATQKQVLTMIRDLHVIKALEKRLHKERAKSRRLQGDLLTLMGTLRRTNGDYQHALDAAKRAQKADELSAKKAEIMSLTRALRPLTEKFNL